MKKTGNALYFFVIGLLVESIFFLLTQSQPKPISIIVGYSAVSAFFIVYRIAIDWEDKTKNKLEKKMTLLWIKNNFQNKSILVFVLTIAVLIGNTAIVLELSKFTAIIFAFASVYIGLLFADVVREGNNIFWEKIQKNKTMMLSNRN